MGRILVAMFMLAAAAGQAQAEPKPVGLAGASYGTYEVKSIIKNVLCISDDFEYLYENRGDGIPVAEYGKYSLVILAHSVANPLTAQESGAVQKYLEDGGHLLLVNSAPISLAKEIGLENMKWFGPKRVSTGGGANCIALKPNHPLLKGVFDKAQEPSWLKSTAMADASPGFEALIGTRDGRMMVGIRTVGKGWVAFAGHELFRLKPQTNPDADSYVTLLRNIVAAASPLTKSAARDRAVQAAAAADAPILLWNREWQRGEEYGPQFDPILPTPAERITALSADMAVDEVESLQLNVTPLVEVGNASWEIVPGTFPRENVEFLVQDRPDPIPWPKDPSIAREAPYWLLPPNYVEPKGKPEFTCTKAETRILWLRINTFKMKPGEYGFALNLSFAGGQKVSVPVAVKVYPVRVPRRRLITLAAGGQVYGDVNNPPPAVRFARDLEAHGYEWSLINVIRLDTLRIAGTDSRPDAKYYRDQAKRFEAKDFPALDCSAWDEWMEQAIGHGLIYFAMADVLAPVNGELAKTKLPEETKALISAWFSAETARYLREKGVELAVLRYGDELSEKEIREKYIPWAKPLTAAGWGCGSTFTGAIHLSPALNAELYPWVRLWTLNRALAPAFVQKVRAGELKVRPDAILGTYGAGEGRGSEHRKPLSASRFLGWESWRLGIQNCFTNPYFKGWLYYCKYTSRDFGITGERWVSYIDRNDLSVPVADCPFLEGIRDGMEEGNLCAMLAWYLDHMDKASPKLQTLRTRLDHVLDGADAPLEWRAGEAYGMPMWHVIGGNENFRKAKREVLEIFSLLREEALKSVKPSLFWNDVPLVTEARPVAAIYAGRVDVRGLARAMEDVGGVAIPVRVNDPAIDPKLEVAIVVGTGDQNDLVRSDLGALKPGSYVIRRLPAERGRPRVLLIAGVDEAGTRKGMEMFAKFLRGEGNWLVR